MMLYFVCAPHEFSICIVEVSG